MPVDRNSNIELLRIVAILGIICHHVLVHGVGIYQMPIGNFSWGYNILNNMCYVGVNVFILISGYFSIRFSWSKLLRLYLMCAVVGGLCYIFHCFKDGMSIGHSLIYQTVFAFSQNKLWYILPYICLFLLSPFINRLLEHLSNREFLALIAVLLCISCYFGWFWHNDVNQSGFGLMQFVTIYVIGYAVKRFDVAKKMRMLSWGGVFAIFVIMQSLLVYFIASRNGIQSYPPLPSIFAYNSPLLIVASISLFSMFEGLNIHSTVINWIAKSTFGIYLLHCNPYIWDEWTKGLNPIYMHSAWGVVACVLMLYAGCLCIEMIIRYVVVNPTHSFIVKYAEKKQNK